MMVCQQAYYIDGKGATMVDYIKEGDAYEQQEGEY